MKARSCRDWREVSRAVAGEQDPQRLMELVEELNRLLEERERQLKQRLSSPAWNRTASEFVPG